jgi:hypothetical protein
VYERRVLRRFGDIKVNENCRKRYNEELMQLFGNLGALSFVRISLLNWICHVKRRERDIKESQLFNINLQEGRLKGQPQTDCGTAKNKY